MSSSVPPPLQRGRSETPRRARSASGTRKASSRQPSRESSVSSDVRCGCQFFQSDSLLPERVNPVGRPSSRASNKAVFAMASSSSQQQSIGDHEYEPISAPPPMLHVTDVDLELGMDEEFDAIKPRQVKSETSSTSSRERRFLRIPLEDDLQIVLHGDGEDEDEAMSGRGEWEGGGPGALNGHAEPALSDIPQKQETDDRYFANTPTTEASATDRDVNTSQLDSSGLEEVPLKRENRKKSTTEEAASAAGTSGFQQKLRSQAGRIRTKLRNIKRPTFNLPERPKFNLPERPKFNLPERPKFNLPERPKFHMPERPKFNLPERPKFHMPERPKFNFPDRSKFRLPERPKINLPERPKFNFPDRPKFNMSELGNKIKEGRKKISSSVRRPLREKSQNVSSAASTSSSPRKNIFDFKTYPRIFDRKAKQRSDYATSSPKATRGMTPPPPARKKGPVGSRWMHRFGDMKYADTESQRTGASEDVDDSRKEDMEPESGRGEDLDGRSESTSAFQDKDYGYAVTEALDPPERIPLARQPSTASSAPESDREQRSSGSSSDRRRAGVLEEIDSDEFFLREKGLSQEDVEVGRYLTSEIRDAFRAPSSQMDVDFYDDDIEDAENLAQQYRGTPERVPIRPARTRTLRKRSSKSKESTPAEGESETKFSTFPPTRPQRSRSRQSRDENEEAQEDDRKYEKDSLREEIYGFEEEFRQESLDRSREENQWLEREENRWQESEDFRAMPSEPPMPPKRARRGRREVIEPDALCNGNYTKEDWMENVHAEIEPTKEVTALRMESDYIIPSAPLGEEEDDEFDMPPEPPRRGRRSSRGTTSLADEDRTSQGAESIASERDQVDFDTVELPDTIAGYAFIDKPSTKPRRPKPPRPAPPNRRKKNGTLNHFFSLPLRGKPVRPLRNYSTLGPSRPPRKTKRVASLEYMEPEKRSEAYIEIEEVDISAHTSHAEESHESARDLQSGDIVERMKGRPLPPPPRPPRKGREGKEEMELEGAQELKQGEEEEEVEEPLFDIVKEEPLGALSDTVFYSRQRRTPSVTKEEVKVEREEMQMEEDRRAEMEQDRETSLPSDDEEQDEYVVEEISRATQTDPLPEGVDVVVAEDAGTDTVDLEKEHAPKLSDMGQQTSMPESYMPPTPSVAPAPTPTPLPPPQPTVIEKPIPYYVMPDPDTEVELKASKLQVSELDVERLTVGELQANKILVSDIDGVSMQVAELTSRSGNIILSGLELPPGFLQELVESLPISQYSSPPQPLYYPPPSQPQYSTPPQSQHSSLSSPLTSAAPAEASSPPSTTTTATPTTETMQKSKAKETEVLKSTAPLESSCSEELRSLSEEVPKETPKSETLPDDDACEKTEVEYEVTAIDEAAVPTKPEQAESVKGEPAPQKTAEPSPTTKKDSGAPVKEAPEAATKSASPREEVLKAQSIPIHAVPMHSVGLEQLHSFEFIPSAFPVSVRVPSRQRRAELESDEEVIDLMQPQHSVPRRRRHHKPALPRYSDEESEEEETAVVRPASRRHQSSSHEPSSAELTLQLIQACQGLTLRAIQQIMQYAGSHLRGDAEDKRRDMQMVLCILLIVVAGLILLGYGSGKTYHTHHWDYHFPPR